MTPEQLEPLIHDGFTKIGVREGGIGCDGGPGCAIGAALVALGKPRATLIRAYQDLGMTPRGASCGKGSTEYPQTTLVLTTNWVSACEVRILVEPNIHGASL